MRKAAATDRPPSQHLRIEAATPLEDAPEEELARVSWPLTLARLTLAPEQHPWAHGFRVRRRAPLLVVAIALLLLLFFAASGCASAPRQSLAQRVSAAAVFESAR